MPDKFLLRHIEGAEFLGWEVATIKYGAPILVARFNYQEDAEIFLAIKKVGVNVVQLPSVRGERPDV